MDTVLAPFIIIPVALTLLVCGMIFAAWYWRRRQALKRGVSMPVITRVAAVNTPVGHTKMTRTGYYPTHPNASSTWPPTSEFSTTLAVPSFSDVPLVAIKGIRNTPALKLRQRSYQLRTIVPSYRTEPFYACLATIRHRHVVLLRIRAIFTTNPG